jgi:hypothetical protein
VSERKRWVSERNIIRQRVKYNKRERNRTRQREK